MELGVLNASIHKVNENVRVDDIVASLGLAAHVRVFRCPGPRC